MKITMESWKKETLECIAMLTCMQPTGEYIYKCAQKVYIAMRDYLLLYAEKDGYDVTNVPDDWDTCDILFHIVGKCPTLADMALALEYIYISPPLHIEEILYRFVPMSMQLVQIMVQFVYVLLSREGFEVGYKDNMKSYVFFGKCVGNESALANCFSVCDESSVM